MKNSPTKVCEAHKHEGAIMHVEAFDLWKNRISFDDSMHLIWNKNVENYEQLTFRLFQMFSLMNSSKIQ